MSHITKRASKWRAKEVALQYNSTQSMVPDVLTKAWLAVKCTSCRAAMGVCHAAVRVKEENAGGSMTHCVYSATQVRRATAGPRSGAARW